MDFVVVVDGVGVFVDVWLFELLECDEVVGVDDEDVCVGGEFV